MIKTLRVLGALAALAALTVVGATSASASAPQKSGATVIKMERDGKDLFFTGPETVERRHRPEDQEQDQPAPGRPAHLLARSREGPADDQAARSRPARRSSSGSAARSSSGTTSNLQTGEIGENPVEVGKQGWDRQGNLKRRATPGSAERKGETFTRKVTAKPGKTLHFVCAVHPFMQGEIAVIEG